MESTRTRFAARCLAVFITLGTALSVLAEPCELCKKPLELKVYLVTDQVIGKKIRICPECSLIPDICAQCGLPVYKDYLELPDGRYLCFRDRKNAVLSDEDAKRICEETIVEFTRSFSRLITIPDRNVNVELVDRVTLTALFKLPGNDFECPNILGYLSTATNGTTLHHELRLMSAQPPRQLKSVCVHEYGHAWVNENVPSARRDRLHRDAIEGFCELLAYLLADQQKDTEQVRLIEGNSYTRGQLPLFQKACATYGLNEVIDWMIAGADRRLTEGDPGRIRLLEEKIKPAAAVAAPVAYVPSVRPAATRLQLKAVNWSPTRPLVVINNETFGLNDRSKVALGGTNVTVQCLAITPKSARVRVLDWDREEILSLP